MKKKKKQTKKTYLHHSTAMRIVMTVTVLLAIYGLVCLIGNFISCTEPESSNEEEVEYFRVYRTPKVTFNGQFASTFDDVQEVQIESAMKNGIVPLEQETEIRKLLTKGRLVKVGQGRDYDCQADYPYLVPMAADLLEEVKHRYQALGDTVRTIRLTGCLRTKDSVKGLKRRNVNSVENSCHLYGTTIDISYARMSHPEKKQMAQVLYELQQAGYCYVKYERKQPCFHITVRRSPHLVERD